MRLHSLISCACVLGALSPSLAFAQDDDATDAAAPADKGGAKAEAKAEAPAAAPADAKPAEPAPPPAPAPAPAAYQADSAGLVVERLPGSAFPSWQTRGLKG